MANKARIRIHQAALEHAAQETIAMAQPEYIAALQVVVRGVRDDMEGQPAEEIHAELGRRLHDPSVGASRRMTQSCGVWRRR